jgi:hypothetical protein
VPFSDTSTMVALLAAPVLGVLMFATAAVALAGLAPWWIASSLVCALVGIHRRVVEANRDADFAIVLATDMGPVPLHLVLRLTSGWDAAVLGGLLSFVLPDATVLLTVMIAGLFYAGWAKGWTVRTRRRRVPRGEAKSAQERAERLEPASRSS